MKWLENNGGMPEGDGIMKSNMDNVVSNAMVGPQRTQDDAAVGYVFQRPADPEFPPFGPKQLRWAQGDDTIIENQDKWKYPSANHGASASPSIQMPKVPTPPVSGIPTGATPYGAALPSSLYDLGGHNKPHMPQLAPEQLIYMPGSPQLGPGSLSLHHHYVQQQTLALQAAQQQTLRQVQQQQQQQQQQQVSHTVPRSYEAASMIAPSAKKLWGLETKDGKSLALNHLNHDGVWRDPTWAAPGDHAVTTPLAMGGRRGVFPGAGGDPGGILSPRGSDGPGGLGVKMVEYVLGTSPTGDKSGQTVPGGLEQRMRVLHLDDKDHPKDKGSQQSPKDEQGVNGQVVQQQVNGDDDKGFNRTPGSRQPSPSEEDLNKNGLVTVGGIGGLDPATMGLVLKQPPPVDGPGGPLHPHQLHHHLPQHHALGPHLGVTLAESVNQQFAEHFADSQQAAGQAYDQSQHQQYAAAQQQHQVDNAVLQQQQQQQHNFDVQQLFRSQQTQAATPGAAAQLQLLQQQQQQQYLAAAQQQQAAAAAFTQQGPYVLNAQQAEPYLITAGVPAQYYGVGPWVYPAPPANLAALQQGASNGARRPLTPNGTNEAQQQVQPGVPAGGYIVPAYYEQGGAPILVAQGAAAAALRNGHAPPMRLVSPAAPVLVPPPGSAPGRAAQGAAASLYGAAAGAQGLYGAAAAGVSTSVNGTTLGGVAQGVAGSALFPALPPSAAPFGGSSQLGAIGSTAQQQQQQATSQLHSGLGLNTTTTGRRDSFDRNTSAFSPSLDYRQKWNTPYNIGSSPSPLTGGNLTPPPAAPLQLGGLVNSRVLSAAPGAEAKYRNSMAAGLNATTMFGSTNSLFTKINSSLTAVPSALDKTPQGRSRLLEDFRNNRYPNLQLRDLANHIVEFSQDQHGSRFIQQKLERATAAEKQMVFNEILSAAYNLMTDVFGNYVIQKFFEFGTSEQKTTLAQKVRGHVLPLALQMYGCRVIQKALESIPPEQQQEIVRELDGHVLKCVKDQNGNHVVQKCIECVDPSALQFIISSFSNQVYNLSTHPYGCRVIQRILEHCTPDQTSPILAELHQHTDQLIQDQFGNYVIQHVLEHGKPEDKSQLITSVRGKVLVLSQHKFASNVVEKCVTHATRAERALLIEEVCGFNDNALHVMMKDQYANYVVQKMIDVSEPTQRKVLMHKIRPHLNSLRKYTYGKHIIAKLEKYFMKAPGTIGSIGGELGPIGPPTNGVL
ncbi:pumilio homolog 2-like isoform X2 [Euwallacea fornicatus]|uniref:pumilio homolog 2-like isoform X2 n=1 Tax=Euwallacea fornicatus TaxID=995702 RepID=UPI0033900686